jgi:protein-tyrosine phosphatase
LLLTRNRINTILEFIRPLLFKETWDHFRFDDLRVGSAIFRRAFGMFAEHFRKLWRRATLNWKLERQHRSVVRAWRPRNSPPKILFVCFGNICRSPVAEYLARRALPGWSITSAGFFPKEGRGSPEHIRTAAAELGLEMSAHSSRLVTASEVEGADLILVMDSHNMSQLRLQFPSAMDRTTLLGFFGPQAKPEISDPFALSASEAMTILRQIEAAVNGLHTWITSKTPAGVLNKRDMHA